MTCRKKMDRTFLTTFACFLVVMIGSAAHAQTTVELRVDGDSGLANPNPPNPGDTWQNAFKYLQDGLDQAVVELQNPNVDTVQLWVAATVETNPYRPDRCATCGPVGIPGASGDPTASFSLINNVGIYGGFLGTDHPVAPETQLSQRDPEMNVTVLSGAIANGFPENIYNVVRADLVNESAVLNGFTITGGRASGNQFLQDSGGGMRILAASPTVVRCIFSENRAEFLGGGIYVQGLPADSAEPTLINCTLTANSVDLSPFGSGPGGGLVIDVLAAVTLVNCVFSDNSGSSGGAIVVANGSQGTLTNCTISGNSSQFSPGGIANIGQLTLTNCILWGNTFDQIGGLGVTIVTYSDVEGGWDGAGNIDADPLFVDPANGDFTVKSCSPVVDAADNDALPLDVGDVDDDGITNEPLPRDLDLNDRRIDNPANSNTGNPPDDDPYVDMGAYEHVPDPCPWDLNGDCCVDAADEAILLDAVGTDPGGPPDFDCNGDVDRFDHLELIQHFGPCSAGPDPQLCPAPPPGCGVGTSAAALGGALAQIGFADVAAYAAWVPPATESEAFVCACVLQVLLEAQP